MKLSGIGRIIASVAGIGLMFSCMTQDRGADYQPRMRTVYDSSYFDDLLSQNEYHRAYNEFHARNPLGNAEDSWESLEKRLNKGMADIFEESLENNDFNQSFSLYNSLASRGGESLLSVTEGELNFAYLNFLMEKEYTAAAGSFFLEHREGYNLEQLDKLKGFFAQNHLISPLKIISPILKEQGGSLSESEAGLLDEKVEKRDMLNGTVTIWVNRGIRLEKGVGYPDRVIGSGFFIDLGGYILTNYHVISSEVDPKYEGYSRLYIKLNGAEDEKIPAKVVGWDPILDLALLKAEITSPYAFSFAAHDEYDLGDSIFAIGSPGGLTNSVTSGTISNTERRLQPLGQSLQVDVPINPGNSGGPLLNQSGEIIGVVYAGIESYEGVNFAIPSDYVKDVLPRLYEGGQVSYSWIGAVLYKEFDNIINRYTIPDSMAALSGLKEGDIIREINGVAIEEIAQAQDILINSYNGELINVKVEREGVEINLPVALEKRPEQPMRVLLNRDSIDNLFAPLFGMKTVKINRSQVNRQYRIDDVFPGSIADDSGLVTGDSFSLRQWKNDEENEAVIIQIIIKARKSGFMESGLQMGSWFDVNYFL